MHKPSANFLIFSFLPTIKNFCQKISWLSFQVIKMKKLRNIYYNKFYSMLDSMRVLIQTTIIRFQKIVPVA